MSSLQEKTEGIWDAVIIGAGVAGGVSSAVLAERGWRVLLVEKQPWPREKACGGCLNAAGVRMLRGVGLGEVITGGDGRAISHFEVHVGKSKVGVKMPAGVAVGRREFDARLVKAAEKRGVVFVDACVARIVAETERQGLRRVRLKRDQEELEVQARVVLACDGLNGASLNEEAWAKWEAAPGSWIGVSATIEGLANVVDEGTIGMFVARGGQGYVGIVRQGDGRVHVGAAVEPKACNRAQGAMRVLGSILEEHGVKMARLEGVTFEGTRPLTGKRPHLAGYRVLSVGDACGYVEPFTGEGMSWAIQGALGAVSVLPRTLETWDENWEHAWEALHEREIVRRQAWSKRLRAVVRRPLAARACVGVARWLPWMAQMVARRIST